jgi:hypothetical protein
MVVFVFQRTRKGPEESRRANESDINIAYKKIRDLYGSERVGFCPFLVQLSPILLHAILRNPARIAPKRTKSDYF